ncbi:MAG: cysteine--tRNA ligase [Bacteroidetes bacterium]|nr:MAG: cysteine--tRNA ligase [Bacteroidota bacterium]
MKNNLTIYNTLSRRKEKFEAINPPFVGMYVCGPTVYGDAHLGHARPAITFDLLFRYLKYLEYNVRYVRNITDVGHLVNDADEGEDKIAKKAKLDQVEPMEIVQKYTNNYHRNMDELNTLPPSIEPHASAHIIEQEAMAKQILKNGFAYEVNGSVYFDVEKYSQTNNYGKLSGRKLEDLQTNTRELAGQSEKKNPFDFALWKKAEPEHIMRWPSEWSNGFPGWHLECSVMSTKYLGDKFDIHGGGLDLQFPHHECEIAQSKAAKGEDAVKYWMHNNLITIEGQKMSKSLGNFITLDELFSGKHDKLEKAYNPMVVRFFILQAHYRSTLDFSNKALQASEKGLQRLFNGLETLKKLKPTAKSSIEINTLKEKCFKALNDDLNTPILIAHLFDGIKMINQINTDDETISKEDLKELQAFYKLMVFDILGFKVEKETAGSDEKFEQAVNLLLNIRLEAKKNKDFATSDKIRDELNKIGIIVKDKKDGFEWEIK